ncbi:MAG TPA: YicC/YloC family endoribonuclease [Methylomirabilota bacterium]|jgi:uncharacterized protein (TIGR00255 family)
MGLVVSMTGYGRGEARGARIALTVEARSVNHRFLETSLKLPRGLTASEPDLRRLVQGRIARGRVDVTVTLRKTAAATPSVRTDIALGLAYARGARALGEATGIPAEVSAADLLRLPGVVTVEDAEEEDGAGGVVLLKTAATEAIDELCRMRQTEGAALARDLGSHVEALGSWVRGVEGLLPAALARIQARLRDRVQVILGETPADPGRLAQEVATWAARSDVAEELARLGSHLGQLRALLAEGGAVGRQLDFLTQELHREVNTIASKADDGELVARALEARTLVERIREQVQNVE